MSQENVAPEPVSTEAQPPTPAEIPAPTQPPQVAENEAEAVKTEEATENADVVEKAIPVSELETPAPAAAPETEPVEAVASTAPTEVVEVTAPATTKSKRGKAEHKSKKEEKAAKDAAKSASDATIKDKAEFEDQTMDENQGSKTDMPSAPVINIVLDDTSIRSAADGEIIEEFFLDGSFDEAKSYKSMKSTRSIKKHEVDPDIDQLADIGSISETETESDTDSQCSFVLQKELVPEPDFFETFGKVPSLSRISLDESVADDDDDKKKLSVKYDSNADIGHFVDPLTGELEPSIIEEPEPEPEPVVEEEEEEGEEEEDLLLPPDIEDDVTLAKVEDDALDTWYQTETPKVVRIEVIDFEEIARLELERQMHESAIECLDDLIAEVVERCEYVDPNIILRQSLDKKKLMEELNLKLNLLDIDQKARFFLNRKTVEFFRRKKSFRSISEDNPDTIKEDLEKYKVSTALLDQLLSREEETNFATARLTQDLELEAIKLEEEIENIIKSLEDRIKKTLHRDGFEHLQAVIENQLSKMAIQRQEVSNVRLMLIQRQHTLASIMEKSNALENIGNGLSLRNHEHLQTATLSLTKKIEERNTELIKFRARCNADLHEMAHIKERQQMMRNKIAVQEQALQELMCEKQDFREHLFNMKVTRSKIRAEISHLSFQGGLIDKPALMYDFDATMERVLKLRTRVELMRQRQNDLQQKITSLEGKCI